VRCRRGARVLHNCARTGVFQVKKRPLSPTYVIESEQQDGLFFGDRQATCSLVSELLSGRARGYPIHWLWVLPFGNGWLVGAGVSNFDKNDTHEQIMQVAYVVIDVAQCCTRCQFEVADMYHTAPISREHLSPAHPV